MQKAATRYQQVPGPEDYAGWLFLMQHHRLPTRLLDWTESPLIACFFAVQGDQEQDGCIWALSPLALNARQFQREFIGEGLIHPNDIENFLEVAFRRDEINSPSLQRIIAILTTERNVRMLQQQSVFTFHGTPVPLNQLPECESFMRSFRIPAKDKNLLLKHLLWLGIRESSLFPDLDYLATDICSTIGGAS